jgi:hypothetical protein
VLDLIDAVESDLSVFHRVEEWQMMSGPRFCRLVPLLPAYGGAVAKALAYAAGPPQDPNLLPVPTAAPRPAGPTPISPAVAAMDQHNSDLFSFATTGGGDV